MHKMDTLTLIETFYVEKNEQQVKSMWEKDGSSNSGKRSGENI